MGTLIIFYNSFIEFIRIFQSSLSNSTNILLVIKPYTNLLFLFTNDDGT